MTYLTKPFEIMGVKILAPDVKLLRVKSGLNPEPGEFLEVSIPGIGECPLASVVYNQREIELLIRNVGNVTNKIFELKPFDKINIRGPYGKGFPLKKLEGKNLILIAGGTGIAPITSLIDYIEKNRKKFGEVFIFFGFKNKKNILLKERIKEWVGKFNVTVCIDKPDSLTCNLKCETGFVHEVLDKRELPKNQTFALICGPEIMMKCVTEVLDNHGLKINKIYWSLERRMECGLGMCNRCLIQDKYVCKDGPVFRYDIIKPRLENEESNKEK